MEEIHSAKQKCGNFFKLYPILYLLGTLAWCFEHNAHVQAGSDINAEYFLHYFMRKAAFSWMVQQAEMGGKCIAADHEERKLQRCI